MAKTNIRTKKRIARHARVRKDVFGTPERPRLCVYRSLSNIFAQIIDDTNGVTIVSASSLDKDIKPGLSYGGNKAAAKIVGEALGKKAVMKGIKTVSFDRGGCLYHGRIKELADGARAAGLEF